MSRWRCKYRNTAMSWIEVRSHSKGHRRRFTTTPNWSGCFLPDLHKKSISDHPFQPIKETIMAVQYPTPEQIWDAAEEVGLDLTEADVKSYLGLIKPNIDAYNLVDTMPDNLPAVKYPRTPGYFPDASQNPRNAWYVRTSIKGASSGVLKGKRVAVKDNVMVAGVPMMNGNSILEGYVPEIDATVVARLLDAGAEIIGKTH